MKHPFIIQTLFAATLLFSAATARAENTELTLALELNRERDHAGTAIEFRRLALASSDAASRAAYFWSAAYETWQAGNATRADALLDRAEDEHALASPDLAALRGELALARNQPGEAAFHFAAAARSDDQDARDFALRKQTVAYLRAKDNAAAQQSATEAGNESAAITRGYLGGRDKSPTLGGWLGLAPGLGYAYAGEYANALRSLVLNGLFIWGMVETADDEQWGAFAAITFFEITWYSGSIYGGIDASHRYNERRRAAAEAALVSGFALQPDYRALPTLELRYRW